MENENELTLCIEMFEAWAKTKGLEIHPYINAWTEKVDYQHSHINAMWDGWQAAWNTRNPAPSRMPENEANKNVGDLVAIQLAFEAGRWLGQVDLEEHYDREQYSQVMPEVFASRKTSTPNDFASTGKTVRLNLRSDKWREGVKKSAQEYLEKARQIICPKLTPAKAT